MSVKDDYERCLAEFDRIRKAKNAAHCALVDLQMERHPLLEELKSLVEKTSTVAEQLRKRVSSELSELEKQIAKAENNCSKLASDYDRLNNELLELRHDPTKYIEEQSSLMTQQLVNCVNEHELRLGRWHKANFFILLEEHEDRYGDTPTGNIKICCHAITPDLFATSTDFYFEECLYEASWGPFDNRYVLHTDWFKNYQKSFFSALKVKITTAFEEHPNFKAQFTDDQHFTLELR